MSRRPPFAVWAAAVAALLWSSGAGATVMVELPLEDMVRDADAIVHGVVVRTGTQMVMREGAMEPHTLSTLRVRRWLKGEGGDRVTLRELGGEWQGGGMRIDGTPRYEPGEEVIVFLERSPEDPSHFRTYGMVQGKFIVLHGVPGVPSMVRRDLDSIAFARWAGGQMTVEAAQSGPAMELEGFLDLIARWAR